MVFDPLPDDLFEDDEFEDPLGDDRSGGDRDDDLEETFSRIEPATLLAFIAVLVLVHVGLFSGSLGLLLIGFRGQWLLGGGLAIGGALAFVLAVASYRRYRGRR